MHGNHQGQPLDYDAYVRVLQSLPDFSIDRVDDTTGRVVPYFDIPMRLVVERAIISEWRLRDDINLVSGEVLHWGRLRSVAERVVLVRDREYKSWKARQVLHFTELLRGQKKSAKGDPLPPTKELVEAHYRTTPEYEVVNRVLERAKESYSATDVIHGAFVAKRHVLQRDVFRAQDGSLQRLSP